MLVRNCAPLLVAALLSQTALAQEPVTLPLPRLEQCAADTHPRLPEKWRATYLMAPFTRSQLVLSDIVYDAALPAMRVTLHGVKRGSADLLVVGDDTYVLSSAGTANQQCRS